MILSARSIVDWLLGTGGTDRAMVRRWTAAFGRDPELAADLIRRGGLLELRPERLENGVVMPDPIDPVRLAYEQGRRALAIELLAVGRISHTDLNELMEQHDVR